MVNEVLVRDDINVIVIDWSGGSMPPYSQAVANIRLVGVMVAHLILFLQVSFPFLIIFLICKSMNLCFSNEECRPHYRGKLPHCWSQFGGSSCRL